MEMSNILDGIAVAATKSEFLPQGFSLSLTLKTSYKHIVAPCGNRTPYPLRGSQLPSHRTNQECEGVFQCSGEQFCRYDDSLPYTLLQRSLSSQCCRQIATV
uniref:SFRICE_009832 n=1 Tax=Spodoptera frugiperda TaxID=7108 RepID=A0A2H1WCY8_SPOFR